MTIMDNSNPSCFWYEIEGPKAGIKHAVKNLGWIIRHRKQVKEIHLHKSLGGGAHFQATLDNGRRYYARFNDASIAERFANARRFYNAEKIIKG